MRRLLIFLPFRDVSLGFGCALGARLHLRLALGFGGGLGIVAEGVAGRGGVVEAPYGSRRAK